MLPKRRPRGWIGGRPPRCVTLAYMSLPRPSVLGAWLWIALTQGCSSSTPLDVASAGTGGGSVVGMAGADGELAGSDGSSPSSCKPPGYHVDAEPTAVGEIQATIQDASGVAVPMLPIQVCGTDQCTFGSSNATGKVDIIPKTKLILPAFKYGDGLDFAELAIQLVKGKQDLGTLVALPFPAFTEGGKFPESGRVTNGDLTLSIEATTTVQFDRLSYADSELVFRTVSIPIDESQKALDPSFGFELAYAAAPLGTTFCPPAQLSLKNRLKWPAGTAVELFVQGVNADEAWAPYGTWIKVAEGSVSRDGSVIDTTSGGITVLSSIAVRRK